MDVLINADLRAKELEQLFINYSLALMETGYVDLKKKKQLDHLDDIADILQMTRQLGKIYTGIDLAPDMSLNFKVNTVLDDLLANPLKSTPNDMLEEFLHEQAKEPHLRNTTNTYQERREENIRQIIKAAEVIDFTGSVNSVVVIDNTRLEREEQLNELSRVVEGRLESLNQISAARSLNTTSSNTLSPQQQLTSSNNMSATRSNTTTSSSVFSASEGLSNLVSSQIIQHLSNISHKLDERPSSNFLQLSQNIGSLIQKLSEQQVVISRMSEQHDVMSQILEKIPIKSVGLTVPKDASAGANIPHGLSDVFLSSNQFAHNIPLS